MGKPRESVSLVDRQWIAGVERIDVVCVNRPKDRSGRHAGSGLSNRSCRTESQAIEAESTLFHDAIHCVHQNAVVGSLASRRFGHCGPGPMGSVADGAALPDQLLHAVVLQRLLGSWVCSRAGVLVVLRSCFGLRLLPDGLRSLRLFVVWFWRLCVRQLLDEPGPIGIDAADSEHR